MMRGIDEYSPEEFEKQLQRFVYGLSAGIRPREQPLAFLLGGQSGAGKTRLQRIIMEKQGFDFIVINGDEFRSAHPHFAEIQEQYGIDAPAHTAAWSGKMVEALIDAFSQQRYNLIIEGTLRTSAVPLSTASLLRGRGYDVRLAIMAVKPEISLASCQIRYEQMRIAGTTPRAVDPAHHKKIVDEIAGNLALLERSDLFSEVALYNRAADCLFAEKLPNKAAPVSMVLQEVLFGGWTEEEQRHYATLLRQLAELQNG